MNGTYSAFLYAGKAVALLRDFGDRAKANSTAKMFMYLPCVCFRPVSVPSTGRLLFTWDDMRLRCIEA